jgi:hypothetical protein
MKQSDFFLRAFLFEASMSKAIESIVSGYVLLQDRKALGDLLAHRQKLLDELKRVDGIDPKLLVTQIGEEIAVIEAGLECLDGKAPEAQLADRGEGSRSTVSDVFPTTDEDAARPGPASRAAGTIDRLVQPPAQKADVEMSPAQVAPAPDPQVPAGPDQEGSQIKVLGLVVSMASTRAATPPLSEPAEIGGLDPGSSALCPPLSNQPAPQISQASKDTETPYSAIDAFKSLVSVWNDRPTKS